VACGISPSFDVCFQTFKSGCCINDGTCDEILKSMGSIQAYESR
jgi:hypothetical protein